MITGGASGIGAATSIALAQSGYSVVVADRDLLRAETVAGSLPAADGACMLALQLDVSAEASVTAGFSQIEEKLGPIAVLVAAAGVFPDAQNKPPLSTTSVDSWEATEKINGFGTFLCVREYLRHRHAKHAGQGRIVTFTSIGYEVGAVKANVSYAASKGAVVGITRVAAKEGAPLGITANCVAPGFIETPMLAEAFPGGLTELAKSVPLGRAGTAEEVAALVKFLVSPDAGYITGNTIDINGGIRFGG